MNHYKSTCSNQGNVVSIDSDFLDNYTSLFDEMIGSERQNNYCKFKLKKNRKFEITHSQKRIRILGKKQGFLKQNLENIPPMAPENTTQYLTGIRRFSIEEENTKIDEGKAFRRCLGISERQLNNNNSLFLSKNGEKFIGNINNSDEVEKSLNESDFVPEDFVDVGKNLNNFNFDYYDDEFFTGSTMKSIVESITKSKTKILSNSLNLDNDQSNNKIFEFNRPLEDLKIHSEDNQTEIQHFSATKNVNKICLKFNDFYPIKELNELEVRIQQTENTPNSPNFLSNYNFLEGNLDFIEYSPEYNAILDLSENSTNVSSSKRKESFSDSISSPNPTEENSDVRTTQKNSKEFQNCLQIPSVEFKENCAFFLLGNKKSRAKIRKNKYEFDQKNKHFYIRKNS